MISETISNIIEVGLIFEQKQTHFKVSPNKEVLTYLKHLDVATQRFFHHGNIQPEQISWNAPLKRLTFMPLAL